MNENKNDITKAIENIEIYACETHLFGDGNSTLRFYEIIAKPEFWNTEIQKHFVDFRM